MEPPERTFSHDLMGARQLAGLNRADFAQRYQADPTVITRIESGDFSVTEKTVRRYAAALGLRVRLSFEPDPKARMAKV